MIQVANDRIPTLAFHLEKFLCCMTMVRAHPGLRVFAFCSDSMYRPHLGSSHNCCSCSFRSWLPLRSMVQVQRCTYFAHFEYFVELFFVDSIDVCDCVCTLKRKRMIIKNGKQTLECMQPKTNKQTDKQTLLWENRTYECSACCLSSELDELAAGDKLLL